MIAELVAGPGDGRRFHLNDGADRVVLELDATRYALYVREAPDKYLSKCLARVPYPKELSLPCPEVE